MSAVLNTVYNNYLTAYSPRQLTKYDTHKKSELRSVYNSIIKLNKDAPWYLPTTSKDTQYYAVDAKENARELHNSIAQLGGLEQDGMFRKKVPIPPTTISLRSPISVPKPLPLLLPNSIWRFAPLPLLRRILDISSRIWLPHWLRILIPLILRSTI